MRRLRRHMTLTVKIGIIVSLLPVAFVGLVMLNFDFVQDLVGSATGINQAGSLRMRAYKLAYLLQLSPARERSSLDRTTIERDIIEFDQLLGELAGGTLAYGMLADEDREVTEHLGRVRHQWEQILKPALRQAIEPYPSIAEAALREYVRAVPGFVLSVASLVDLMEDKTSQRIEGLRRLQFVFLGLAGVLFVATVLTFRRVVRGPVRELTQGIAAMTEGTTPWSLPISRTDELGALARAFESLHGRLQHHIEHLEAMQATGQEYATFGTAGLERVLKRTADLAAGLVGADLAFLLTRHSVLECWIVEAASGELFDVVRKQVILFEETPSALQALESRQPVTVIDTTRYADQPILFRDRFGAKSCLVVPLLGPHEAVGVMVLVSTTRIREFSERDIRLAQQSAVYVTIALENARLFEVAAVESGELRQRIATYERSVAELTHEVKAPAGRVVEFASWIKQDCAGRLDDKPLRYLDWIQNEGRDLVQLAERTMDLARISTEPSALESVDTNEVADEVLLAQAGACGARGIRVTIAPNLPRVACRRIHLKQILENLVSNAVKFMGAQRDPKIEVGVERVGPSLWLFVRDNGVGIDPSMVLRIFEPFQRLGTVVAPGAGIGLSIVKTVAEHYGGEVAVDSVPARGSTFRVRLPIVSGDRSEPGDKTNSEGESQATALLGRGPGVGRRMCQP